MENQHASPIFIHSLFRAGSTYLFNVFRRSDSGYWCYQEPLNERLINKASKPGGLLVGVEGADKILRHPKLEKPHSFEFHVVADEIVRYFHEEFSYDQYFARGKDDFTDVTAYFTALRNGAQGRAVFQCCRTAGRVLGLKTEFAGVHIFLWRNPWDQWWSYKRDHYFDSRNLFISGAKELPNFLRVLKEELEIPEFHNIQPAIKHAYFTNRMLDSIGSYKLFYGIWCHAMLEAKPHCECSISIDRLSTSNTYRDEISEKLQRLGVDGLNFTDCAVPIASYGESDGDFFLKVEDHVHELLLSQGVSAGQVNELIQLSEERKQSLVDTSAPENFAIRDAMHVREYLKQAEAKLSEMQTMLFNARAQAQQAETRGRQAK